MNDRFRPLRHDVIIFNPQAFEQFHEFDKVELNSLGVPMSFAGLLVINIEEEELVDGN